MAKSSPRTARRAKRVASGPQPFTLAYFLICDEARFEQGTNKGIFIGVYTNVLILAIDRAPLERLNFVFAIKGHTDEPPATATFHVEGPSEVLTTPTTFSVGPTLSSSNSLTLAVHASGLRFTAGEHRAILVVNEKYRLEGRFDIVVDPALIKRLKAPFPQVDSGEAAG